MVDEPETTERRNSIGKYVVIHPFLFAIARIVSYFSHNMDDVVLAEIFKPILYVTCTILILFLILVLLCRNIQKAGLILTFFVLVILLFTPLNSLMARGIPALNVVALLAITMCVLCIPALLISIKVLRTKGSLQTPTKFLNAVSIFTLAIPLFSLGTQIMSEDSWKPPTQTDANVDSEATKLEKSTEQDPDIYYIIPDAYARNDVLKEVYNYDNSAFLDSMRKRGFYIADKSFSNYAQTTLSLSSSLNLNYLDKLGIGLNPKSKSRKSLDKAIKNNEVLRFLKERGYTFIAVATGVQKTDFKEADIYLAPEKNSTEFVDVLLSATLPTKSTYDRFRGRTLFALDRLMNLPETGTPRFVFVHVISPHPPFVFGANGKHIQPNRKYRLQDGNRFVECGGTVEEYIRDYPNQLEYLSTRLRDVSDTILSKSPNSIIIIQSDHGPGSGLHTDDFEKNNVKERHSIINAYYLPYGGDKLLYPGISPVNTFRVVMNHYFGKNYEVLPDRAYFSCYNSLYVFHDVTETISADGPEDIVLNSRENTAL